jgi:hypothetical protein
MSWAFSMESTCTDLGTCIPPTGDPAVTTWVTLNLPAVTKSFAARTATMPPWLWPTNMTGAPGGTPARVSALSMPFSYAVGSPGYPYAGPAQRERTRTLPLVHPAAGSSAPPRGAEGGSPSRAVLRRRRKPGRELWAESTVLEASAEELERAWSLRSRDHERAGVIPSGFGV